MSKEKYNQIIDEAYEKYMKWAEEHSKTHLYEPYTQEQFINKCKTEDALSIKWIEEYGNLRYGSKEEIEHLSKHYKTDPEFSERWGLKIEERELSLEERAEYKKKRDGISRTFVSYTHQMLDNSNIPTKLITITYNNETIESYES